MIARLLLIVLLLAGAAFAAPARAQATADSSTTTVMQRMQQFNQTVNQKVQYVVTDVRYSRASRVLFLTFTLLLVLQYFIQVGVSGFVRNFPMLVERVVLINIAALLLFTFGEWTAAVQAMFGGFGEIIQVAMTGDADPFAPAFRLMRAAESIQFDTGYQWLDWGANAAAFVSVLLTVVLLLLLCVVAAGASMWAFWGFTLLKLVGPIFVPFMLFDRLSSWFDNWFNLFASFLLYGMLIGVAVNLAAWAFYIGQGFTDLNVAPGTAPLVIGNVWELLPLIFFACLSLWGIVRCGSIANAITGGGGGVSSQLRGVAVMAGRAFG